MDYQALADFDLFEGMNREELEHCAAVFEPIRRLAGERVTREDDYGYSFFVVLKGRLRVDAGDETVAELATGDCFGEVSLVTGKKRNATVVALESCELAKTMTWDFQELMKTHADLATRIQRLADERS